MTYAAGTLHTGICSTGTDGSVGSGSSAAPQVSATTAARTGVTNEWQTVKLLLSGGISGAFSKSCTAPLARMTIMYQVIGSGMKSAPPPYLPVPSSLYLSSLAYTNP